MNVKKVSIIIIVVVILILFGFYIYFKDSNNNNIPNDYIAVFNGGNLSAARILPYNSTGIIHPTGITACNC